MAEAIKTMVVGSFPQPDWLIDKEMLSSKRVPRVRVPEVWRVDEAHLGAAQDDATLLAVAAMERCGVDVVSDGEMRRESYFNQFANAIGGLDLDNPGKTRDRMGLSTPVPRVVGPLTRRQPILAHDAHVLLGAAQNTPKLSLPGPFTLSVLAVNEHYPDIESLAFAYADIINKEIVELRKLGISWIQLDEPYLQARPDAARKYAVEAINRALQGIEPPTVVHICFGYADVIKDKPSGYSFLPELERASASHVSIEAAQPNIDLDVLRTLPSKTVALGVLDLGSVDVESPAAIAARLTDALKHTDRQRLMAAPDCGMKYLPFSLAQDKLAAMCAGAALA